MRPNKFVVACALVSSLTFLLVGYDIEITPEVAYYIQGDFNLTDSKVDLFYVLPHICCAIGAVMAGITSNFIGRRNTIIFSGIIIFLGALLTSLAPNYLFCLLGQITTDFGGGFGLVATSVYIAEIAPRHVRGLVGSFPEIFFDIGILLSHLSNFMLSRLHQGLRWRIMLGIEAILSLLLAICMLIFPESPRWLVMQGRITDATEVMRHCGEAHHTVNRIRAAVNIPEHATGDIIDVPNSGRGVWMEFLHPTPILVRKLLSVVGLYFFQQAIGVEFILAYSGLMWRMANNITVHYRWMGPIIVVCAKTIFVLPATLTLDAVERRTFLLSGIMGMVVALGMFGSVRYIFHDVNRTALILCLADIVVFIASFSMSIGPITWIYGAEILPLRFRALGIGIGVAVNRLARLFIVGIISLIDDFIGIGGVFQLLTAIALLAWVFCYRCIEETLLRHLEDSDRETRNAH